MNTLIDHPRECWMWGRTEAIGTSLYWLIHHKVLRRGSWIFDTPYSCANEVFAKQEADKMIEQKSLEGRNLYQEVTVSGPYVSWREIWWKHK